MSYSYETERPAVFTDQGIKVLLKINDNANELRAFSGAFTVSALFRGATGDSFTMLACVDFLVETGRLRWVSQEGATQDWIAR